MVFATVFRHVPPPIIGTIGTLHDRAFETFEAHLEWLETTGVLVERFDPATAEVEVARRPEVQQVLSVEGRRCLPLILVNEVVVSRGAYPSRAQLARAVGRGRGRERRDRVRQLAALGAVAAVGTAEELMCEAAHARDLGISEGAVRLAAEQAFLFVTARALRLSVRCNAAPAVDLANPTALVPWGRGCHYEVGIRRDGAAR